MSILNRPTDGLASVLVALVRTLRAFGPMPGDDLLALVAPTSVVGVSDMARKTLHRWTQLGVFRGSENAIQLGPAVEDLAADDVDALRRALLGVVLAEDNNPRLDAATGDASTDRPLASDFTRATCWVLAQDPYAFDPSWLAVEALQNSQRVAPKAVINDVRWQGFLEWSTFFGFAWRGAGQFVVEPHFAVAGVLREVFVSDTTLPAEAFFGRLAAALPVVDGGLYRGHVDGTVGNPPRQAGESGVSMTLSAALLHLEAAGTLRLEVRSDAPTRTLLGRRGRELRPVSHLTLLERA